jgi:hypothetical protein
METLKIHRLAWREFRRASAWYMLRNRKAAIGFMDAVWHAIEEVVETPIAWPLTDDRHRFRLVKGFPYQVIYRWQPDIVHVVAVAHLKRRPGHWIRRK